MSVPQKPNKENFRLLDFSSDGESDDLQLEIIPSRKKKITRRERSRSSAPQAANNTNLATEARCAVIWAVRGTLFLWLLMLTWICASLYDQISIMNADITKVTTSSSSVSDSLQLCHTTTKELRGNASKLDERLTTLESDFQRLLKRVDKVNQELDEVSKQLDSAPQLTETPKRLQALQMTMGHIGSQIAGFTEDLNLSKKQASDATAGMEEVKSLLQRLEAKSNETIANVSADATKQGQLSQQLASLNSTLLGKVEALEQRINKLTKPLSTLAPSTLPTTVQSINSTTVAAAGSNGTITPPPPKQGPQPKPSIVHTEGTK